MGQNKKLYVVTCFVEGCEVCGNTYHVVGAFTTKAKAEAAEKEHNTKDRHLHPGYTDIKELNVDQIYHKEY